VLGRGPGVFAPARLDLPDTRSPSLSGSVDFGMC
jgi:hypothetical protein